MGEAAGALEDTAGAEGAPPTVRPAGGAIGPPTPPLGCTSAVPAAATSTGVAVKRRRTGSDAPSRIEGIRGARHGAESDPSRPRIAARRASALVAGVGVPGGETCEASGAVGVPTPPSADGGAGVADAVLGVVDVGVAPDSTWADGAAPVGATGACPAAREASSAARASTAPAPASTPSMELDGDVTGDEPDAGRSTAPGRGEGEGEGDAAAVPAGAPGRPGYSTLPRRDRGAVAGAAPDGVVPERGAGVDAEGAGSAWRRTSSMRLGRAPGDPDDGAVAGAGAEARCTGPGEEDERAGMLRDTLTPGGVVAVEVEDARAGAEERAGAPAPIGSIEDGGAVDCRAAVVLASG